ncbi:inactive transglutaminase family protein [Pseudomonas sp. MAP12]|uniref:Inactive transglutaminase family protein n=1 Tax=Geopseudomonas aromaticivorans TaxID=2849492 RepID=A0ABS6MR18_9GAMM|nr:inactive transglutaminase family protein [Pseudomonas aromaticivorans]MBV2131243.1 inactive transglutaminase family protein [Pseudomonas aromaticivorans]
MRSLTLHLKVLIAILVSLGVAITAYQIFVLGIPVTEAETDNVWNIDAKIEFQANPRNPIKVQMFVPPLGQDFVSLNESFISNNYGVSVNNVDGNRRVTWSARRANGPQTLYYRMALTQRFTAEKPKEEGPIYREGLPLAGPEQIAAEALLAPIRQHSADVETFISETIKRVNNLNDDNVKLLLAGDTSVEKRARVIDLLLSIGHVPLEQVHTIRLIENQPQTPELWLRSFNGANWLYFNPDNGQQGLPRDRLIWWLGDAPLLSVDGGKQAQVNFTLNTSELNAIRLAKQSDASVDSGFLEYSLYGLPLQTQQTYQIMIMIPIGVLVILILRNLGGLQTLGTFTPVLIALAFRETQLGFGIALFTIITALGLSLRSYLEHLKLQMLPRLSVVLTFVVVLIAVISLFSHKLGLERGLSVALFPMVILTMTIERLSITWEERGGSHAFKVAVGTLIAATLAYLLMTIPELTYFIFTFPAVLLILVGFMLAMGRYRGYRLTELFRFKAFLKD